MTDRPILFSGPMVRALLAGTKTQTRRVARVSPAVSGRPELVIGDRDHCGTGWHWRRPNGVCEWHVECPYGAVSDKLWVRESWAHDAPDLQACRVAHEDACGGSITYGPYYRATEVAPDTLRWRPSIHMPRWASRITLEITDVRVERLHEISEADAKAEGVRIPDAATAKQSTVDVSGMTPYRAAFASLWDEINGDRAPWSSNPWVWVVAFKRVEEP